MKQNHTDISPAQQQSQHKARQISQTSFSSPSKEQGCRTTEAKEAPAAWHCDTYCRKVRYISCEGRALADPSSPNRCPYLEEMLY